MGTKSIISTTVILCIAAVNSFASPPTEGSLVKGSNGAVYVILEGKRCGLNLRVMKNKGYNITKAITLADADLKNIPLGPVVLIPYKTPKNGDIVRGSSLCAYVIQDGKRCAVSTPEVLKAKGFKIEETFTISDADLEAIPQGEALSE